MEAVTAEHVYEWSTEPLVAMYQKLFITQAAVCELYFRYDCVADKTLWITPVSVLLAAANDTTLKNSCEDSGASATDLSSVQEQRYVPNYAFYMAYDNFFSATSDNVKQLLEQFWTRYQQVMDRQPALAVLGLDSSASMEKIRQRYRELAACYHPDKGGEADKFIEIRRAYESLKSQAKI
ncbi:J domain-containing protein [Agarilytica rhodophyticola]|uniref:J domain-containing protein n=1 Tax=Agarilytica rhodophyticola TaxID=1737490 RepID=UPI001C1FEF7E|nr:J domain-containing protein [Agarilytica rhodophyticola]